MLCVFNINNVISDCIKHLFIELKNLVKQRINFKLLLRASFYDTSLNKTKITFAFDN